MEDNLFADLDCLEVLILSFNRFESCRCFSTNDNVKHLDRSCNLLQDASGLGTRWPRVHRLSGAVFLLDWALIVGPTSFYLSLVIRGDSLFGTLASMSLLDVTFLSYYFFWRAFRVARERDRTPGSAKGARSLQLHGNLMGFGTMATMNQLPQRAIMLSLMAIREATHWLLRHVVHVPGGAALVREWLTDPTMFGLSMYLGPAVTLAMIDGPRTPWFHQTAEKNSLRDVFWGSSEAEERERESAAVATAAAACRNDASSLSFCAVAASHCACACLGACGVSSTSGPRAMACYGVLRSLSCKACAAELWRLLSLSCRVESVELQQERPGPPFQRSVRRVPASSGASVPPTRAARAAAPPRPAAAWPQHWSTP